MTGSYLFNYELYYNGLMTDWGLCKGKKNSFTPPPRKTSFKKIWWFLAVSLGVGDAKVYD